MKKIIGMFFLVSICGSALMAQGSFSAVESLKSFTEGQGNMSMSDIGDIPIPAAVKVESEQEVSKVNEPSFEKLQTVTGIQDVTPYLTLKTLFERGKLATKKNLTGWYSGRMVSVQYPEIFAGALSIGGSVLIDQNGGPLFDIEKDFLMNTVVLNHPYWMPGYFDDMDSYQSSYTGRHIDSKTTYCLSFPAAEVMVADEKTGNNTIMRYRKSDGYIITHYLVSDATGKTLTENYAYYFKNVTPKK